MNAFYSTTRLPYRVKKLFSKLFAILFLLSLLFITACKKQTDYFSYVSELRSNIFLSQEQDASLRIFSVQKETPYQADGIPKTPTTRTEFYFYAGAGNKDCFLEFSVDGKTYSGDMSFDNVKAEYYYSCTLDISHLESLNCTVRYGEKTFAFSAKSVRDTNTLAPKAALEKLISFEPALFSDMTDKYGFAGEIYIRLIYEDAPFYYIGVIDRSGNIYAFLFSAETGKVLAKRQP